MVKQNGKASQWPKIRKFFNDIHMWLGLMSGVIVILICLSGTIYVYNTEITEKAAPHLYKVIPDLSKKRMQPEDGITIVEKAGEGKVASIVVPAEAERTFQYTVRKKEEKGRGTTYMLNPYTGEITGNSTEKNGTKDFMGKMFSLHRWLLLDKIEKPMVEGLTNRELGSMITGWTTILFTLGCITGLIIWFPRKLKNWRAGLQIKWGANWKRLNHDLHNTLAFYALIFLLLMGITGPQWSFEWYRTGLQKTLGTYKPKDGGKAQEAGNKQLKTTGKDSANKIDANIYPVLPVSEFINIAGNALNYEGDYNIQLPAEPGSPVIVSKTNSGFFASPAADRLTINAASGEIIKKEIFADKPFNEKIAGSIKALHVGNVYGKFSKLLYFIACLIATSLPVTGTLIWLNKLKQKRKRKKTLSKEDESDYYSDEAIAQRV
jgi:uncharacterized iron-regulated membrane protein